MMIQRQHQGGQAGGHVTAKDRERMTKLADKAYYKNDRVALLQLIELLMDKNTFKDNKP